MGPRPPVVTCRFGIRASPMSGPDSSFEVFDRTTGAAVTSGMARAEAEAEARHRNHDTSGPPAGCVHPPELAALRATVDAYLARAGDHCRSTLARTAQALDELRAELTHADRLIAEQQARL